jgi:hypothetical protein
MDESRNPPLRAKRYHFLLAKVIRRREHHFPPACHEPQLEFSAVDVHRRGNGRDGPALSTFAAGGGGAGDRRYSALVDLDQRCIRHEDGQPASVVFQEVGKHLELAFCDRFRLHR